MDRETIDSPPGGPTHMDGMVPGVRAGNLIFFSAIRGRDPVTKTFSDDTREQAAHAFESIVDPPPRTAFQVVDASASPKGNAHFVRDVVALAE